MQRAIFVMIASFSETHTGEPITKTGGWQGIRCPEPNPRDDGDVPMAMEDSPTDSPSTKKGWNSQCRPLCDRLPLAFVQGAADGSTSAVIGLGRRGFPIRVEAEEEKG
jgi:hypothetical protein